MYTPLYFGATYIYRETILLTVPPIFITLSISTVTRKSSNNRGVLAATTILYVTNIIEGLITYLRLPLLIGTSGKSMRESVSAEYNSANGKSGAPINILVFIPLIVADGLLVRCLFHAFDLFLHVIGMAVF